MRAKHCSILICILICWVWPHSSAAQNNPWPMSSNEFLPSKIGCFFCYIYRFSKNKFLSGHKQQLEIDNDTKDQGKETNRVVKSLGNDAANSRTLSRIAGYGFLILAGIGVAVIGYRNGVIGYVFLLLSLLFFFVMIFTVRYG